MYMSAAEHPEDEAVVSRSARRESSTAPGHRGFGGLEGLGLGTPVVS